MSEKHIYRRCKSGREYLEVNVSLKGEKVYGGNFALNQLDEAKAARDELLLQRESPSRETEVVHSILKEAW